MNLLFSLLFPRHHNGLVRYGQKWLAQGIMPDHLFADKVRLLLYCLIV